MCLLMLKKTVYCPTTLQCIYYYSFTNTFIYTSTGYHRIILWINYMHFETIHPSSTYLSVLQKYMYVVIYKMCFPCGSVIKNLPAVQETQVLFLATHSNVVAWEMPWTEELGGLQSIGLQKVEHDWNDLNIDSMHI